MQSEVLIKHLNSGSVFYRKILLSLLKKTEKRKKMYGLDTNTAYNFNIRTDYSFSPYNPTMAAFMAYKSGVSVAGICDFGTVAGYNEFASGCRTLDIFGVCGFEMALKSPELGNCTGAFYGVCKKNIELFEPMLKQFRELCEKRASAATERVNNALKKYNIAVDYEKEVYELTCAKKNGTITLKHVFKVVAVKIIEKYGKGKFVADFLRSKLCLDIDESEYNLLCDAQNPFYMYDLIAALRKYYKETESTTIEFPSVKAYTSVAADSGVIAAYEYSCKYRWLTMETESQKAVSEFSELLDKVKAAGFNAVCLTVREYSKTALKLFIEAVEKKELLVILSEKNEYPRSMFGIDCPDESKEYVENCALAIAGNALSIAECQSDGIFSDKTMIKCPSFEERVALFASIGRKCK